MDNKEYKSMTILIIAQVTIAVCGFLTLMAVFEFPDILRQTSAYRLNLFLENLDYCINGLINA